MRVLRGVVYMKKSSGPRTEPWGTPQEEVCQEDRSVSHFTRKQRDDRYDLNQLRTEPWKASGPSNKITPGSTEITSASTVVSTRRHRSVNTVGDDTRGRRIALIVRIRAREIIV